MNLCELSQSHTGTNNFIQGTISSRLEIPQVVMRDAQVDMRNSHGALKNIPCRLEKFHVVLRNFSDDLKLLEEFHDSGVSRDDLSSYYAFQKAWCEDFIFVMHGLP